MPTLDKYPFSFTEAAVITIPGVVHNLHTADLGLILYEMLAGSRRVAVVPGRFEVEDLSLDVTITLAQPMSGRGVLFG